MVRIERMARITDPVAEWPETQRSILKERLLLEIHEELIKDVESALELVDNQVHDICDAEGMDPSEFLSSGGIDPEVIARFRSGRANASQQMGAQTKPNSRPPLIEQIHKEYRQAASIGAIVHAVRCGELLVEAKQVTKRGDWTPWLEEHWPGSVRLANDYMRLAKGVADGLLPDDWKALSIDQALKLLRQRKRSEPKAVAKASESKIKPKTPYQAFTEKVHGLNFPAMNFEVGGLFRPFHVDGEGTPPRMLKWDEAKAAVMEYFGRVKDREYEIGTASGEQDDQTGECHASKTKRKTVTTPTSITEVHQETLAPRSGRGEHPDWEGKGFRVTVTIEVVDE